MAGLGGWPRPVFARAYEAATGAALPDAAFAFGDGPAMADELGALVAAGTKTATSSLAAEYERVDDRPQVGGRDVVLDGAGDPICVIETTEVTSRRFDEVDAAFAYDEGEDDRSLAAWREAHERFFGRRCELLGLTFDPGLEVVCERFRAVWQPEGPPPAAG